MTKSKSPASGVNTAKQTESNPRPVSPSNSFYALSDDEEGDYNTVTHTSSGRGVKLLFSKSKVSLRQNDQGTIEDVYLY
jgi:hypothetical protein